MTAYVTDVWQHRHFWLSLVQMDLRARYRRSVLGVGWSLLHPICTTAVLCVAFYKIFNVPVRTYLPFLMCGLSWWGFITGTVGRGCQCFVEAEGYIRQHPAPIAIYPLRAVLGGLIHLLIALAVVLVLTWSLQGFHNLATLPMVAIGLSILLVFGWSMAVLAGYINTIFRDVQHITDIAFQILFYLTPILYPSEILVRSHLAVFVKYNPLTYFLRILREPLLGALPSWRAYAIALGCTVAVTAVAVPLLGRLQRKVILYL
ncbi:MAG: sugar ABC transporter permease [Gemmatales bacterium]|nr:MAG: sugar ABC transporter permease [Gemmatales bacterium]